MKFLFLFLISFNLYAQHVITLTRHESGYANSQWSGSTKEASCEKLAETLTKRKWLKYEWTAVELGSECSRPKQSEEELGIIDTALEFVGLASGEIEYLHPINFVLSYEDKTQHYLDIEANKSKLDKLKEDAKTRDLKIDEINELLRLNGIL